MSMQLLRPTRELKKLDDGTYELLVTPPKWSGFSPSSILLTAEQVDRLAIWQNDPQLLIQNVLPELTPGQREIILSGINESEWETFASEEEDDG